MLQTWSQYRFRPYRGRGIGRIQNNYVAMLNLKLTFFKRVLPWYSRSTAGVGGYKFKFILISENYWRGKLLRNTHLLNYLLKLFFYWGGRLIITNNNKFKWSYWSSVPISDPIRFGCLRRPFLMRSRIFLGSWGTPYSSSTPCNCYLI